MKFYKRYSNGILENFVKIKNEFASFYWIETLAYEFDSFYWIETLAYEKYI